MLKNKKRKKLRTLLVLLLIVCSIAVNAQLDTSKNTSKELVFASDTQAPMWIETLVLKRNNNKVATRSIFDDIYRRRPAALYLLGDVVSMGSSNKQWKPMDAYLKRLQSSGIMVNAALGNHEVLGRSAKGQQKFQIRFPNHVKTGSLQVIDSVAVILLNSNFGSLTSTDQQSQMQWYKSILQQLDTDPAVRFIISGCHHSPYTNSKIVGSSIAVRDRFVPLFLKSNKSRLFLSGHSHNFEYFKQNGKDFLVIGGGGGLHQPLKIGEGLLPDLSKGYKPLFHYLSVKRIDNKLQVASEHLTSDFSGFEEGFRLEISE